MGGKPHPPKFMPKLVAHSRLGGARGGGEPFGEKTKKGKRYFDDEGTDIQEGCKTGTDQQTGRETGCQTSKSVVK